MPKLGSRLVTLPVPPMAEYDAVMRWRRLDEKIRTHIVARYIAGMPKKWLRADYLEDMDRHHPPAFMARMRRLVRWYWRQLDQARKAHQNATQSAPRSATG